MLNMKKLSTGILQKYTKLSNRKELVRTTYTACISTKESTNLSEKYPHEKLLQKSCLKQLSCSALTCQNNIKKRYQSTTTAENILLEAGCKSTSSRTKLYYRIKHYIKDDTDAKDFVKNLKEQERQLLLTALEDHNSIVNGESGTDEITVSNRQLKLVFLHNCIPFVGFGFLDNFIMISAGEYIDLTIGCTLGITTMAAAAIGNLISDLAGIGLAGYVEALCGKVGLPVAQLTQEQAEMNSPRTASYLGKAVGIIVGCIIGMFPLWFARDKPCDTCHDHVCDPEAEAERRMLREGQIIAMNFVEPIITTDKVKD